MRPRGPASLLTDVCTCPETSRDNTTERAIYGFDSRQDVRLVPRLCPRCVLRLRADEQPGFAERLLEASRSVCAIGHRNAIDWDRPDSPCLRFGTYGDNQILVEGTRFSRQPTFGYATGFLIAPDLIATAGHVVGPDQALDSLVAAFDFVIEDREREAVDVCRPEVVTFRRVVASELEGNGPDWAILALAQPTHGRKPLNLKDSPDRKRRVYTLGHPAGLPLKLAGPKNVRPRPMPGCFSTNLDALSGNSGSPVFDAIDHTVVGVVSRGDRDYRRNRDGEKVLNKLSEGEGLGEVCTLATYVKEACDSHRQSRAQLGSGSGSSDGKNSKPP